MVNFQVHWRNGPQFHLQDPKRPNYYWYCNRLCPWCWIKPMTGFHLWALFFSFVGKYWYKVCCICNTFLGVVKKYRGQMLNVFTSLRQTGFAWYKDVFFLSHTLKNKWNLCIAQMIILAFLNCSLHFALLRTFHWKILRGSQNGSSVASLWKASFGNLYF